jgi:hypothetical protein
MKKVVSIAYHRNGVSGDPFYVALVEDDESERGPLLAIVPDSAVVSGGMASPQTGCLQCYVINPLLAAQGTIEFGPNSWRGDKFFDVVVEAAKENK